MKRTITFRFEAFIDVLGFMHYLNYNNAGLKIHQDFIDCGVNPYDLDETKPNVKKYFELEKQDQGIRIKDDICFIDIFNDKIDLYYFLEIASKIVDGHVIYDTLQWVDDIKDISYGRNYNRDNRKHVSKYDMTTNVEPYEVDYKD